MSRLLISDKHLQTISHHAAATYPEECCGFLIGRPAADAPGSMRVSRVLAAQNSRQDSRHNRFEIGPQMVLAAHKEARSAGLEVIGYYHSHPDHPARPSDFDREHAWPGLSYLIVSVRQGKVAETRSWRLQDDRQSFEEETVEPALVAPEALARARRGAQAGG